ncbi:HAD family phosphatase [Tropicimonas sp. IMCC6043]|uniref:HAD family hydrolase n=1 Tax=Tropicimonas sp. IMCC6043 TaxID=2510645 RepID=UPI00101CAED4|nr:HAD family phosphatase [Tropicimonas sp. IMCC6043]RYH10955.1 HAD family phosphatase [Tropicimonas sp. IMCC6043]
MPVELVIFDIGNVLIEWNPERFYDAEIGQTRRESMFAAVDLHGMNDQLDRGADFREIVYALADENPDWRDEIRMWHDRWTDIAGPTIDHSVRLLRALRSKGVPVQALSNFGIGSFAVAEAKWPYLKEFDRRHISGYMKRIKPEPEIYEMVEESCGFAPAGILFVDDRPANTAVAEARGWQTHLFDGPEGWADRLVAEGLLDRAEAS